jgi:gamma-aminobutyric acid type B receptor
LELFIIVGSLLLVDLIVFVIWHIKDPLQFKSGETRQGLINNDVKTVYQYQLCRSDHHMIWIGILYSIKGILIVIGIYLSYETRASKIEMINDAHLVRMCTYNIFVSHEKDRNTHIFCFGMKILDCLLNFGFVDIDY